MREGHGTARPRVALVAHGIHDLGGMEQAFAELARRVHERFDVVVLSSDLGENLRGLVEWRRVPVPRRPAPLRFALFYALGALRLALTRSDVVHTLGAIVPNRADLVTVHFCTAGYVEALGRWAPPNAPGLRRANTALARMLSLAAERWSFRPRRVGRLAAVSAGVARELEHHYPGVPVVLTPNGVDGERFRPDPEARRDVRRELGVGEDEVVVLFVGGDWHGKGLGLGIEAFAAAARRVPGLHLLVAGHGDEWLFGALARELGVGDRVVFLGVRRDVGCLHAAADVFLLPSWYETFSLAAHEAAASGVPVVATRVNGIEELLAGGEAGVLVDREPNAIADALVALAENADERRRLGAAARARAVEHTWDRSAAGAEAVYRAAVVHATLEPEAAGA